MGVACSGEVLAALPLPIAGLMSDRPLAEVARGWEALRGVARRIGSISPEPFMALSFIALPVIPELKLTDRGLVDVNLFGHASFRRRRRGLTGTDPPVAGIPSRRGGKLRRSRPGSGRRLDGQDEGEPVQRTTHGPGAGAAAGGGMGGSGFGSGGGSGAGGSGGSGGSGRSGGGGAGGGGRN